MGGCQLHAVGTINYLTTRRIYTDQNSFGKKGSDHAEWERATWPALRNLAENQPESGIHFQGMLYCPQT
jgi:hypothetical protein